MIILIKNEEEIGYKITLGRVRKEELIELELEGIWREGVGGEFLILKFFYFLIF